MEKIVSCAAIFICLGFCSSGMAQPFSSSSYRRQQVVEKEDQVVAWYTVHGLPCRGPCTRKGYKYTW